MEPKIKINLLGLKDSEQGKSSFESKQAFYEYPEGELYKSLLGLADSKDDIFYESRSGYGERRSEFIKFFHDEVLPPRKMFNWAQSITNELRKKKSLELDKAKNILNGTKYKE